MNRKTKKVKTRAENIEEVLLNLEKNLSNFQLIIDKRDRTRIHQTYNKTNKN